MPRRNDRYCIVRANPKMVNGQIADVKNERPMNLKFKINQLIAVHPDGLVVQYSKYWRKVPSLQSNVTPSIAKKAAKMRNVVDVLEQYLWKEYDGAKIYVGKLPVY